MQPDAWARLVDVFSPIVYRWARQAGLTGADAADVVQDVFVAVARNIGRFERQRESASFRSWLATITRNRVRDRFRQLDKNPAGFGGTEALDRIRELPDPHGGPAGDESSSHGHRTRVETIESNLEQSISLANLDRSLPRRVLEIVRADCDPKTWQAFWLTTAEDESAANVAEKLGMNVANVYQAKSRILRRLRKRMEELPQ